MEKLNSIALEIEKLQSEHSRHMWVMYTTGFDMGVNEAQQKLNTYLKDKDTYRIILDKLESDSTSLEWRAAKILHNHFKKFHYNEKASRIFEKIEKLETKLADVLNKHRSTIDNKEVTATVIRNILNENADRKTREKAYFSRNQINKILVENGFIDLLKLRKEFAEASGYKNFVAFRLDSDDLTPELFADWGKLAAKQKEHVQQEQNKWAQRLIKEERFKSWDFQYLKNQICSANMAKVDIANFFEPIEKTFSDYGFEIAKLNLTYDIFPRKNKSEWGYNFTIYPGKDSRILANASDRYSYYNVLLHETAHGVHFFNLKQEERVFNQGVSGIVAEGFANFFGGLSNSEVFLSKIFKQDASMIAKQFQNLIEFEKLARTEAVTQILFDQQLYYQDLNSLDDINQLKRQFEQEILSIEPSEVEPIWGYLIHHTVAPVYLHNYFLGDLMCESMKQVFKKRTGNEAGHSPLEFGRFWSNEVLAPSGKIPFPKLYEKVCGEPLGLGSFLS